MKKGTIVALALLVTATLFPINSAVADHFQDTKCASSGDSCISVRKVDGIRRLRLGMLSRYFPRHEVCVKGPNDDRTCNTYRTRKLGGAWGSSVDWRENYPFEGRGIYVVKWRSSFGPIGFLKFHVH